MRQEFIEDHFLLNLERDAFERVLAPKIAGAWNLDQLTRERDLDFFVLFSSVASVLGSPGQANYASANAWMDALAERRSREGFPALSIAWGPWEGVGLAAGRDQRGMRLAERGMESLDPDQGVELFGRLLQENSGGKWSRCGSICASGCNTTPKVAIAPVLSRMEQTSAGPASAVRLALETADPAQRTAMLEIHVREQLGRVLHSTRCGFPRTRLSPRSASIR